MDHSPVDQMHSAGGLPRPDAGSPLKAWSPPTVTPARIEQVTAKIPLPSEVFSSSPFGPS